MFLGYLLLGAMFGAGVAIVEAQQRPRVRTWRVPDDDEAFGRWMDQERGPLGGIDEDSCRNVSLMPLGTVPPAWTLSIHHPDLQVREQLLADARAAGIIGSPVMRCDQGDLLAVTTYNGPLVQPAITAWSKWIERHGPDLVDPHSRDPFALRDPQQLMNPRLDEALQPWVGTMPAPAGATVVLDHESGRRRWLTKRAPGYPHSVVI